ncbi:PREDICTED: uncharacterized protein LOC104825266 [Tarenaya hassleriana]|uniref:uncharacterized protein LOC104825266 n=1 Tax=Tarenaya hassleriana TaxID=28532 RepID=UPI00053C734A|nr:PREDICTED: uncharacterized protein LOC104825266 [Tarenaya hassleriana]
MRLDPFNIGESRVKVEIKLGGPLPEIVEVEDEMGGVIRVNVVYSWLPPRCSRCHEFGHRSVSCPSSESVPTAAKSPVSTLPPTSLDPPITKSRPDPVPQKMVVLSIPPATEPTMVPAPSPTLNSPRKEVPAPRPSSPSSITRENGKQVRNVDPSLVFDPADELVQEAQRSLRLQEARTPKIPQEFSVHPIIGSMIETRVRGEQEASSVVQRLLPGWSFSHNYSSAELGRIWIAWDPSVSVVTYSSSDQMITCGVFVPATCRYTTISFIYARNTSGERRLLWSDISALATNCLVTSRPWLLVGDFNQILHPHEHASPSSSCSLSSGMLEFQDCLFTSGLFDLTARGHFFTWTNNNTDNPITRKLDRALVNEAWLLSFPESYARFDAPTPSDHCPCLVDMDPTSMRRRRTSFKFLKHLIQHPEFHDVVRCAWLADSTSGSAMFQVSQKLKSLKPVLRELNQRSYSGIQARVKVAHRAL